MVTLYGQKDGGLPFFDQHSGEVMILILFSLVLVTLVILVPQLLRAHLQRVEMQHLEHMKALEQGIPVVQADDRSRVAGRTAMLVPMVVICAAGTVTCFLVAYRTENLFGVCTAVWAVSGVVSLAAITGGVALIGRLAQLQTEEQDEQPPVNPFAKG